MTEVIKKSKLSFAILLAIVLCLGGLFLPSTAAHAAEDETSESTYVYDSTTGVDDSDAVFESLQVDPGTKISSLMWLNMGGYSGWIKVKWTSPTYYNETVSKASSSTTLAYVGIAHLDQLKGHDGASIPVGAQIQFGVNIALGKDTAWSDPVTYDPNGEWLGYKTNGTVFKSPALDIVKVGTMDQVMKALNVTPGPPFPPYL